MTGIRLQKQSLTTGWEFHSPSGFLTSSCREIKFWVMENLCSESFCVCAKLGFSEEYGTSGFSIAKLALKQRLLDLCVQTDVGLLGTSRFAPLDKKFFPPALTLPPCFADLMSFDGRKAFTKARLDMLPLEGSSWRLAQRNPINERILSCDQISIENLGHAIFYCPLFTAKRARLLRFILEPLPRTPDQDTLRGVTVIEEQICHKVYFHSYKSKICIICYRY